MMVSELLLERVYILSQQQGGSPGAVNERIELLVGHAL